MLISAMEWRVNAFKAENFKFFKEKFEFPIEQKHVLLYGENGSGKSSLYWGFYTHMQACTKSKDEATKYFNPKHPDNLLNRFCGEACHSYITLVFEDTKGIQKTIEDSSNNYFKEGEEYHKFMNATRACSDFLNYKFLSSIFDFPNSRPNDVFALFEKEFMTFIDIDVPFQNEFFEELNSNSLQLWQKIKSAKNSLPKDRNGFIQSSKEYEAYIRLLDGFNTSFASSIWQIEERANSIIKGKFGINSTLNIKYENATFNHKISGRKFDQTLHEPKIILTLTLTEEGVIDPHINHPRSFFNEAKLTCIALGLRLAILEKHPQLDDYASALFIDDLLISLDMNHRKVIIPVLLSYADKYQMFIFTHDLSFFKLVQNEIEYSNKEKDWKFVELYEMKSPQPHPQLKSSMTALEEVQYHLDNLNFAAAANAERKATEKFLKRILPKNFILENQAHIDAKYTTLGTLLEVVISKFYFPNFRES